MTYDTVETAYSNYRVPISPSPGWGSILDTVAKDTEDTGGVSILSLS